MAATVYLVGAGPGDAGLLTVRAAELIKNADSVVYDRLVGDDIISLIPDSANKIDVGKNAGNHPVPQEEIGAILLREAKEHKSVVRLKGGDPYVFGRGGEEAELLAAAGVDFEVVPGVTSAVAAPAYAGIPVTHRDFSSSLHIITGQGKRGVKPEIDYASLVKLGGTLVFMMSVAAAPEIAEGLISAGMDEATPAAVIESGTTCRQRSFTGTVRGLTDIIARERVKSPAVIVVGGVCREAERLNWFERRPLFGCRVLVTRPGDVAAPFGAALRRLGADVTFYPCIKTIALEFEPRLDDINWAVFTSTAGVRVFFDRLYALGLDARALGSVNVAAVGRKTALVLREYGVRADFTPSVFDGATLARELIESGKISSGQSAALFRARDGGEDLAEILRGAGVMLRDVPVYETVPVENPEINPRDFHYVTFTSASCVRGFTLANAGADFRGISAVCIGSQTAAAAIAAGMKTTVSDEADTESMVWKIQEVWNGDKAKAAQGE